MNNGEREELERNAFTHPHHHHQNQDNDDGHHHDYDDIHHHYNYDQLIIMMITMITMMHRYRRKPSKYLYQSHFRLYYKRPLNIPDKKPNH